jgi:excisionase family DNA binding protein
VNQTVNIEQAARLAGVSRRTIYNWMKRNQVEWVRTAGGDRRVVANSLFRRGNVTLRAKPDAPDV